MIDELTLQTTSASKLRYYEAAYFLQRFEQSCGSPSPLEPDSSFHWIAYSDAFLMAIVSLEELVSPKRKEQLLALPLFRLLKVLRNQTIHQTVFAAPKQSGGANATVARTINLHVGSVTPSTWVEPKLPIRRLRCVLSRIAKRNSQQRKNVAMARDYLKEAVQNGKTDIYLQELFCFALETVGRTCGLYAKDIRRIASAAPRQPDPMLDFGKDPVSCGAPDASEHHDKYLYGPSS